MGFAVDRAVTCAFTGHRPSALPWGTREEDPRCAELKVRLEATIERVYALGYRHFICGMAEGADLYFGEAVVKLRRRHPDMTLEGAVPFPGQADHWSEENRRRHAALLDQCNMETLIQQHYSPHCMHRRNRYMVDHASCLIAVYNGIPGRSGTLSTLNYAMTQGLRVDILEI